MLSGDSSATVVGVIQLRFFVTSCSSAMASIRCFDLVGAMGGRSERVCVRVACQLVEECRSCLTGQACRASANRGQSPAVPAGHPLPRGRAVMAQAGSFEEWLAKVEDEEQAKAEERRQAEEEALEAANRKKQSTEGAFETWVQGKAHRDRAVEVRMCNIAAGRRCPRLLHCHRCSPAWQREQRLRLAAAFCCPPRLKAFT